MILLILMWIVAIASTLLMVIRVVDYETNLNFRAPDLYLGFLAPRLWVFSVAFLVSYYIQMHHL